MSKFSAPKPEELEEFNSKFPAPSKEELDSFASQQPMEDVGSLPIEQTQKEPELPFTGETEGVLSDVTMAGAESATLGARDEILAALKAGTAKVLGKDNKKSLEELYKIYRDLERDKYKKLEARSPYLALGGELAGGFLIPGLGAAGAIGKGANLAQKVYKGAKAGALIGGATGLGKSEESDIEGIAKDTLGGAAGGAILGGAIPAVGAGLSKLGGKLSEAGRNILSKTTTGKNIIHAYDETPAGKGFITSESEKKIVDDVNKQTDEFKDILVGNKPKELGGIAQKGSEGFSLLVQRVFYCFGTW